MNRPTLYVHLADDGGILLIDSATGRSVWAVLVELERQLNVLRASGGSVLLSREAGSRLADPTLALIRSAGVPVVPCPEAHPDTVRRGGSTTLMSLAYVGAAELAQDLIQRGADLEAEDENGFTALMYAAKAGQATAIDAWLPSSCHLVSGMLMAERSWPHRFRVSIQTNGGAVASYSAVTWLSREKAIAIAVMGISVVTGQGMAQWQYATLGLWRPVL